MRPAMRAATFSGLALILPTVSEAPRSRTPSRTISSARP